MPASATRVASAPLRVSTTNPRYFAHPTPDGTERAVYLTGSHIWNNLQDGLGPNTDGPAADERFDFDGYLRFLAERGHNFIRLWRWEQFRSQAAGGAFHLNMTPQPWMRTGPGSAKDGLPRFVARYRAYHGISEGRLPALTSTRAAQVHFRMTACSRASRMKR